MDKWQTQDAFWNSFGIPAYDENTSFREGEQPSFPHITYQAMDGVIDQHMYINASLWYKSSSWKEISEKASQIGAYLSQSRMIKVNGGYLWLHLQDSTPFAQRADSGSEQVKRIILSIEAESLTN